MAAFYSSMRGSLSRPTGHEDISVCNVQSELQAEMMCAFTLLDPRASEAAATMGQNLAQRGSGLLNGAPNSRVYLVCEQRHTRGQFLLNFLLACCVPMAR
jgi:hypothetical protein